MDTKKCPYCKTVKSYSDFHKHKYSQDGFQLGCKICQQTNRNKYGREVVRFKKYGLTIEDFDLMFLDQKGKCKICKTALQYSGKSTHIDHCHTTGVIRGLLCQHCNTLLGMAKDNQLILASAIEYLKESQDD